MTPESAYLLDLAPRNLQAYLALPQVDVTDAKQRFNRRRPPWQMPGVEGLRPPGAWCKSV